jgi:hypothetical protein
MACGGTARVRARHLGDDAAGQRARSLMFSTIDPHPEDRGILGDVDCTPVFQICN